MKMYLTLLFCAPLFLYALSVVVADANSVPEVPVAGQATVAAESRLNSAFHCDNQSAPSLETDGARLLSTPGIPDSTRVQRARKAEVVSSLSEEPTLPNK